MIPVENSSTVGIGVATPCSAFRVSQDIGSQVFLLVGLTGQPGDADPLPKKQRGKGPSLKLF